jgi:phosphomannomutase
MSLFGTAGIRGDARERLTPELALSVGRAVGVDAVGSDENGGRENGGRDGGDADEATHARTADDVVIARDGRVTGPALLAALEAGIESAGARVHRAGVLPTPALAYASQGRRGVMVTASHNPPGDNGLKCFDDGEEYDRASEERIERRVAEEVGPTNWAAWETSERIEPLSGYREAVVAYARGHGAALDGLAVAVDCANGASGLATPQVLRALGAEVLALHANVDGFSPGRESKPTAETLADLRAFVADRPTAPTDEDGRRDADGGHRGEGGGDGNVDLAIAHDGDGDRIVILNGEGEVIHEDSIVAILAERYTRASDAGDPVVVTTPNASSRIDERVAAAGGRVERVRLGALHEGIATARANGTEETSVVFAAEPWKHIHPAFGPWIDGVVSAAVFARLVADADLGLLRGPVNERPYEKTEVDCPDGSKEAAMNRLETALPAALPEARVRTEYGIRLDFDASGGGTDDGGGVDSGDGDEDGWVLVRPSGTEPYLRIYVESESVGELLDRVLEVVASAVADAEGE